MNGSGKQEKCVAEGSVSLQIRNALSLSLTISLFELRQTQDSGVDTLLDYSVSGDEEGVVVSDLTWVHRWGRSACSWELKRSYFRQLFQVVKGSEAYNLKLIYFQFGRR